MADQFDNNKAVASQWECAHALAVLMIAAGWTVHRSSDGTTADATDRWTGNFGSLGASSWIVLNGPGGRQVTFWRNAATTTQGFIAYSKGGLYNTTFVPTAPPTATDEAEVRGSRPGTFANWFGNTAVPVQAHIWARDVSEGSFGVVAQPSGDAEGAARLAWEALEGFDADDPDPYAFWTPGAVAGNWALNLADYRSWLEENNTAYRAWQWAGEPAEDFIAMGGGTLYPGWGSGAQQWGGSSGGVRFRSGDDQHEYATVKKLLWRVNVCVDEDAERIVKGWTRNFGVASNALPYGSTFNSGAFAKICTGGFIPWDNAGSPPIAP